MGIRIYLSTESEERKSLIRQTLHGNHVLQHISSPVYPEQAMSHFQFNPPSPSREGTYTYVCSSSFHIGSKVIIKHSNKKEW